MIFNGENYSKRYYLVYLSNNTILRLDYNKGTWQKIDLGQQPGFSLKDMAPWDRSPRPGVHFKGSTTEKAVFKNFSLAY